MSVFTHNVSNGMHVCTCTCVCWGLIQNQAHFKKPSDGFKDGRTVLKSAKLLQSQPNNFDVSADGFKTVPMVLQLPVLLICISSNALHASFMKNGLGIG